jgi:hypothetical protein
VLPEKLVARPTCRPLPCCGGLIQNQEQGNDTNHEFNHVSHSIYLMFVYGPLPWTPKPPAHHGYQQVVQETFQEICLLNRLLSNFNATKVGKPNQWSSISDARKRLSKTYGSSPARWRNTLRALAAFRHMKVS